MDIQIYQAFHKDFPSGPTNDWIVPVGVGGYTPSNGTTDASGEHISQLNPYYCELTVYYWAWKNCQSEYVGFYHYRRYLSYCISEANSQNCAVQVENMPEILDYLKSDAQVERLRALLLLSDMVIPKKETLAPCVTAQYLQYMEPAPWKAFLACLKIKYGHILDPELYFNSNAYLPIWNILVTRRELFNEYCQDLFQIIHTVFEQIEAPYDTYNNRYPGFLAERFLGYWIAMRRLRTSEVPMMFLT